MSQRHFFVDIGTQINQYQVVEHIGRGGMADVWSARDTRLNRMVAIKTIAPSLDAVDDPVKLFKREAQTIASMEHPHILPIYDFGDFESKLYIVMRYVTGGSLGDVLEQQGALAPSDVVRYAKHIAAALDYAHANKVVHLDLKPQNVLLDSSQSPYLADFGLATPLDREGRAVNPGSGTLLYMAPEQLISEVIDHRADIYAFSLMMYHLLTGKMPFDGTQPLALKQLQFQDDLPIIENCSAYVNEILRRGCAVEAQDRPATAGELVRELESVIRETVDLSGITFDDSISSAFGAALMTDDANLLEAVDLYSRAHYAWAGGQGKFLLGVTHFMLVNDYYMHADKHGLSLDLEGRQMMLRGALEYDREIEYWWAQLDTANRRWVCLHAIRSESAPARIRALYRLETMPDSEKQRIPQLVAQALQVEVDEQAQLAALKVLGTRARLMKPAQRYDIASAYRGRMLSSVTRVEVQVTRDTTWYETVFTPEVDSLVALMAFESDYAAVREQAARTVGRMRSLAGVQHIVTQLEAGRQGAARALAFVRDEAPNLPPIVSPSQRFRAWLVNTWRRLTDNALALTWRFIFALIGGTIGMGIQVYVTYRSQAVFDPDRVVNTYGFGLAFGVMTGLLALFADEVPARLRGFWRWWSRLLFSALAGVTIGTLAWGVVSYMYLRQTFINWELMLFGGVGLALGFVLASLLNLRGWLAVLITAALTYLPVYVTWHNVCWQYQLCVDASPFSIAPLLPIGAAVGLFAGLVLRLQNGQHGELRLAIPSWAHGALGVVSGAAFGFVLWLVAAWLMQSAPPTWGTVTVLLGAAAVGGLLIYWLHPGARLGYIGGALAMLIGVLPAVTPTLTQTVDPVSGLLRYAPLVGGEYIDFLFGFDDITHLFTATVAFALFVALGGYAMTLVSDARRLLRGDFKTQRAIVQTQEMPAAPVMDMVTEFMPSFGDADDMATHRLPPRDTSPGDDDIARLKAEDV